MKLLITRSAVVACSLLCIGLAGCGKKNAPAPTPSNTTANTGNGNETPPADDHDHGAAEGENRDLGVVEVGGCTFEVTLIGHVEAGAEVEVELAQLTGEEPSGIRVWIGIESGVGSMKAHTHTHDIDHHAELEVPDEVTDATALWIEIEIGGETHATPVAL